MKITASRLFDFASIATSQAAGEIKSFIDYSNGNFEKIVRALSGELTLQDNMKGQTLQVSCTHNTLVSVSVNSTSIAGVIVLSTAAR